MFREPPSVRLEVPDALNRFTLLRCTAAADPARRHDSSIYAGTGSRWTRGPAGLGSMSTQRREAHWQCIGCGSRAGLLERFCSAPVTRFSRAAASGRTARPDISATTATNSLLKDHPLVRRVRLDARRGSPPLGTSRHENAGPPAVNRSSRSLLSVLSGFARFHLTLPQAPAAFSRRAERYDGKRDLHFLNAA